MDYLVSDPDGEWSVVADLNAEDIEAIQEKNVPHQIVQICKNTVETSVRMAIARHRKDPYDESMPIDVEALTYAKR